MTSLHTTRAGPRFDIGFGTEEVFPQAVNVANGSSGTMEGAVQNPAKRVRLGVLFEDTTTQVERAFGGAGLEVSNEDDVMASPSTVAMVLTQNPPNSIDKKAIDAAAIVVDPLLSQYKLAVLSPSKTTDNEYFGRLLTDVDHDNRGLVSVQFEIPQGTTSWPTVVLSVEPSDKADDSMLFVLAVQHAVELAFDAKHEWKCGDNIYWK
jgi:hypothetical protein